MVDLHSHILPHIDDGPSDIYESAALMKLENENDVDVIAATPHFNPSYDDIYKFANLRYHSLWELTNALKFDKLKIVQASEVMLTPDLFNTPHKELLCYERTNYMLTEFCDGYMPMLSDNMLGELRQLGIRPIVAHIDKFDNLLDNTDAIFKLVESGNIIQINASSLVLRGNAFSSKLLKLIEHNLVHVIATDTHSVKYRPPLLKSAFDIVESKLGTEYAERLKRNSASIIRNADLNLPEPIAIKKRGLFTLFD
jgi:protein-tyrosine phosphatase